MADDRNCVRQVEWLDLFPWLLLARAFRIAISLRVLVLAAAGLVVAAAGCRLIGAVFSGSDEPQLQRWIAADSAWPWESVTSGRTFPRH